MDTTDEFDDIPVIRINQVYVCSVCQYRSQRGGNMRRHIRRHFGRQVASGTLAESFHDNDSNKQKWICDRCGTGFKTKFGLTLHMKNKHVKTFKHICSVCGKGYNQRTQYMAHCASHNNIPNEKCVHCKQTFKGYGSLAIHIKTCEQSKGAIERNYPCDDCSCTFVTMRALAQHRQGKHENQRYTCDTCRKQFSWRSSLASHKKSSNHIIAIPR